MSGDQPLTNFERLQSLQMPPSWGGNNLVSKETYPLSKETYSFTANHLSSHARSVSVSACLYLSLFHSLSLSLSLKHETCEFPGRLHHSLNPKLS